MKEPKGKLYVIKTELKQNKAAVYVDIYLKDENCRKFMYHTACFLFELKEIKKED